MHIVAVTKACHISFMRVKITPHTSPSTKKHMIIILHIARMEVRVEAKAFRPKTAGKKKKARLNYVSKKCLYFVTSPPDSTEHQGTPTVIPRNTVVHAETSSTRTLAHNQETAAPSVQPKRQPYTRPNDVWNPPLAYERCKPKIIKN